MIYDPLSGLLTWRTPPTGRKVDVAGRIDKHGYVSIGFDGTLWKAHRLIWGIYHNEDPGDLEIDHRDCIKHHNWIENLRKVTRIQQLMNCSLGSNNTSGVRGVKLRPFDVWNASIAVNNVVYNLGNYKSFDMAVAARREAEKRFQGDYRREPRS